MLFFSFYFLNQNFALYQIVDLDSPVQLTEVQEEEPTEEKEKEKEKEAEEWDKFSHMASKHAFLSAKRMDSEFCECTFHEWFLHVVDTPPPELI